MNILVKYTLICHLEVDSERTQENHKVNCQCTVWFVNSEAMYWLFAYLDPPGETSKVMTVSNRLFVATGLFDFQRLIDSS